MKRILVCRIVGVLFVAGMVISQTGCVQVMEALARNGGSLGTAVGAAAAINNHEPAFAIMGTLLGLSAQFIQEDMDRRDQAMLAQVYQTGQATAWTNPQTGNQFNVTPWQNVQPGSVSGTQGYGACREAQVEAWIGGQRKTTYTTACDDGSGGWKVVASR